MKSHGALMTSKSGRVLAYAWRGVPSAYGTSALAAAALTAVLVLAILSPVNVVAGQVNGQQDGAEGRKIQEGFAIAPVPLDLDGKNKALVGLGSYIVNGQGDCNSCHANAAPDFISGGNPYLGEPEQIDPERYLIGGRQFGGLAGPRSRNLTPDPVTGLPAGYTFEEFLYVLRTGTDLKGLAPFVPSRQSDLLQAPMPWPVFRKMTDRDIRAIYEYLRSVPSRAGFPQ
jgi:hypothetical protein